MLKAAVFNAVLRHRRAIVAIDAQSAAGRAESQTLKTRRYLAGMDRVSSGKTVQRRRQVPPNLPPLQHSLSLIR